MIKTILLAFACLASSSMASTLAFATGGGRGHEFVISGTETRVAAGSFVKLGYLSTAGDISSFVAFGTTTISNPSPSILIGGFLTAPVTNTTPAENTAAQGKQVYLWVYDAPTETAATAKGLFTSTDASWTIPSTFTGGATESSLVTLGNSATPAFANITALVGTYSTGPVTVNGTANQFGSIYGLQAVPEPSAALLGLMGLVGLMRRKR